jgi:site-specific DNA recombinase
VLHQNIQLLFSEFDNQLRKQRAVAGMKEKFQKGEWVTRVPQGYDIIKINGVRKIVVNEEGKKLRKAFYWRARGMKNRRNHSAAKRNGRKDVQAATYEAFQKALLLWYH